MGTKAFAFLVVLVSVCLMAIRRPPLPLEPLKYGEYQAMDLAAPQLYGWKLKLYSKLYNIPLVNNMVGGLLWKLNDFHDVHALAYHSNVMPTYEPLKLLSDQAYQKHVDYSKEFDYSQFLTSDNVRNEIIGSPPAKNNNKQSITIESLYNAYKSGTVTPLDIAKQALANAKKLSHLNIFIQLNEQDVLQQAKESTQRWKNNKQLSILDGIPIAVKDEKDVIGYNTTYGTQFLGIKNGIASKDSEIVSRIRQLGAILFGKTNMHEIGIQPNGYNPHWGSARNPYSKNYIHDTGGSSSGSAAAVSSGLVPIAIGLDGGGSIRIPAALNGLVGLKATFARIPFLPSSCCWSVVHAGFLANSLRDQMIGYMAIAGINSDISVASPPKHLHSFEKNKDLSDLTIGVYSPWFEHAQKEVVDACWKMIEKLRDNYGIQVKNITIAHLKVISQAHATTILSEFLTSHYKIVNHEYNDPLVSYSYPSQAMLDFTKEFEAVDFIAAQQVRTMTLDYLENVIFSSERENVDIIVTPTSSIAAPKYVEDAFETGMFDSRMISRLVRFVGFGNLVGIPGLTVSVGYTNVDGSGNVLNDGSRLPIGLQLMANHWNEHVLFRVASVIENNVERELPPDNNRVTYKLT